MAHKHGNFTVMQNTTLSIVVICYDPYSDSLALSPLYLKKHMADGRFEVLYVRAGAGQIAPFKTSTTNGDLSFAKRIELALSNAGSDYLLLLMDDYLVDSHILNVRLNEVIAFLNQRGGHYCQLCNFLCKPRTKRINKFIGEIEDCERYRISLQPSIFSRELLTLLASTNPETPWDGELNLMRPEFKKYKAYYAYNNPVHVVNYIDKGLATRKAYRLLQKDGLWHNQRPVMSVGKAIKKYFVNKLSRFVPQKLKQKLKRGQGIYKG